MRREIRKSAYQPSMMVRSLMALVLSLLSLGVWAQETDILSWGNPNSGDAFLEVNEWTMNWSERWGAYPYLSNYYSLPVTLSSSNESVAIIGPNGVEPVGIGTTTITASYNGQKFEGASAAYTLTYIDDRLSPADMGFGFSSPTASATYGGTVDNAPTLQMGQLEGAAVAYSSSAPGVAAVDGSGIVTVVGAGTTVISASVEGSDNMKSGSASYTLTVAKKEVGLQWGTTSFSYDGSSHVPTATATGLVGSDVCTITVEGAQANAGSHTATASALSNPNYALPAVNTTAFTISKAASAVTAAPTANTLTYTGSAQALATAGSATGGTMQYSLDGQTFSATVPTGTNAGSYVVYYKVVGDANHDDASGGQVSVTINKAASTVSFASGTANAKIGEGFASPTATTTPAGLVLAYSSSTPAVATVDAASGVVTLVAAGSTTITAKFAGNDNYQAAESSYTLTVAKADPVGVELSFASETVSAVMGDATVSAPALNNPYQLPLSWSSSDGNVAVVSGSGDITIVGAGQTVISAAFAGNDEYQAKTVSFTLIVNKAFASVGFTTSSETVALGDNFVSPKATVNPSGSPLVYTSSDPAVATVDENTGEVGLVGVGTTIITASYSGSDFYDSASAYYYLTVEPAPAPTPKLEPIVKEVDYLLDIDELFLNPDYTEIDLSNTIVNNILFTLKNQNSTEGDGYDTEEHNIVINTLTPMSTVNALLASGVEPGSADYASQFTGMTFLVPAGEGYIIVTSQEAEGVCLMVKVGDNEPVAIHLSELGDYSIPYKSDQMTYVYMWKENYGAQDNTSTRGKKTMADVRVTKISYKAISINGIRPATIEASGDDRWYDMNGRRISQPVKKGVYIHGNRKVIISATRHPDAR